MSTSLHPIALVAGLTALFFVGEDITQQLQVPFMTALFGGTERVRVRRLEQCAACLGAGVRPGTLGRHCGTCDGQGRVARVQQTPFGAIQNVQACPTCHGSGQDPSDACSACQGQGTQHHLTEVDIRIPAGVDTGTSLRVRGGGHVGRRGGKRGDLYVQVVLGEHPKFRRDGQTVLSEEEVSYTQAILGTVLRVDTVDGQTEIRIPALTQPQQRLRIRGKGAPKLGAGGARGDHIITMKVRLPSSLSEREKELIEQLAVLGSAAVPQDKKRV